MGRHSFREADVMRDNWGRFGNENNSSARSAPAISGVKASSTTRRGMPDVIATANVKLKGGSSLSLGRRVDGGLTLTGDHGDVTFDSQGAANLLKSLRSADDMEIGDQAVVEHRDIRPDSVYTTLIGQIDRTGSDSYEVRLDDDNPSYDELADGPPLNLNGKDLDRIADANERLNSASRIDTGYGDADVFIANDNKFTLRHLGDDGKPVEVAFDSKSFAKIERAVTVVFEGFDEMETFRKGDAADDVTSLDISTNVGKVRIERLGEWNGANPGDQLMITPVDGDAWGIVVDGQKQSDWWDAMNQASEAGASLGFHQPG